MLKPVTWCRSEIYVGLKRYWIAWSLSSKALFLLRCSILFPFFTESKAREAREAREAFFLYLRPRRRKKRYIISQYRGFKLYATRAGYANRMQRWAIFFVYKRSFCVIFLFKCTNLWNKEPLVGQDRTRLSNFWKIPSRNSGLPFQVFLCLWKFSTGRTRKDVTFTF